jgi:hypothetical protein
MPIYYRRVKKYDRKTRWKILPGCRNVKDGITEAQMVFEHYNGFTAIEVGCSVPPSATPVVKWVSNAKA